MNLKEIIEFVKEKYEYYLKLYNSIDLDIRRFIGTSLSVIFGLLFMILKFVIGVATFSIVFMYSCIYAFLIIACKFIFIQHLYSAEDKKYKAYNIMALLLFLGAFAFNMSMLIRISSVRVEQRFHPLFAVIFSFYLIFSYVISVYGLLDAKRQNDLLFTGLKIVSYSSFFMDLVLEQRLIIGCLNITDKQITFVNFTFGISCGIAMALLSISMFVYGIYYRKHI